MLGSIPVMLVPSLRLFRLFLTGDVLLRHCGLLGSSVLS